LIENLSEHDSMLSKAHLEFINQLKLRSGIFLKLRSEKHTGGILALYRHAFGRFGQTEHLFIKELSDRISLSLANIALYEESQQAHRAKDEFLAIVSHELRTPLVAISGWASILLTQPLPPETVEKALRTIQRSAKLQSDLINDILDFSLIATGKFSMNIEDVQIHSILEETVEAMRPLAEAKKVDLSGQIAKEFGIVSGDPIRLQQVFSNLVANAIKFTPAVGKVTVTLASINNAVEIEITDSGIGMDPEFVPRAFEPFVQADSSSSRTYSGLGLGLAIVRHLIDLHGGHIKAKSEGRGRGTTFTVTLPTILARSRAS
jgi:signal transduction histidine kinase